MMKRNPSVAHVRGMLEEWPFVCPFIGCERATIGFRQNYLLNDHIRMHTGERPFHCTFPNCTKAYRRKENLTYHLRGHTKEKPFKCRLCGKAKIDTSDRAKHEKRVYSSLKHYQCGIDACPKAYTDPSSLRKHRWKFHKGYMQQQKANKPQSAFKTLTAFFEPVRPELWCDANTVEEFLHSVSASPAVGDEE